MQEDLFKTSDCNIHQMDQSSIVEYPAFYSIVESMALLELLTSSLPWSQAIIRIAGRSIPIPRLQCWIGDENRRYSYSGINLKLNPWTSTLLEIKHKVECQSGHRFNAVLANYYRDGNDSVAWHSDNEPELGSNPVVASVSFGACRYFEFKHRYHKDMRRVRLLLQNGSLIVMNDTVQNNWLHQVPKQRELTEPRVNLTFRLIVD